MSRRTQDVFQEALDLPERDRVDLAAELLASLGTPAPTAERTDEEWISEIERRAQAALVGARGIPWETAKADIEARLRRRR